MHIAFWSPGWPLQAFQNGIVTYVHSMKLELERRGHRVSVFTREVPELWEAGREDDRIYVARPTRWRRLLSRLLHPRFSLERELFGFAAVIAEEIKRVDRIDPIDVIEMEESFGWFAEVARRSGIPLVVKLHGPAFLSLVGTELTSDLARSKIAEEGKALSKARIIVSPCLLTLADTIKRYSLRPEIALHVVNPIVSSADLPIWNLQGCDRETILFVGRFDVRKGGDIVLKAFSHLYAARPSAKLIFVGPDVGIPGEDGKLLHFAAYCASQLGNNVGRSIDFRGPMGSREIAVLRTQAMVTVVASRWENQGYTALEAMLQGCPVVSTDAGGCSELVSDGVNGLLARSEDSLNFAAKIAWLLENPMNCEALGRAARLHVLESHSASSVASAMLNIYQRSMNPEIA
jgi:glycosyltransferase involved in cell wall biosynthesis